MNEEGNESPNWNKTEKGVSGHNTLWVQMEHLHFYSASLISITGQKVGMEQMKDKWQSNLKRDILS